jgi:hypothetical protein
MNISYVTSNYPLYLIFNPHGGLPEVNLSTIFISVMCDVPQRTSSTVQLSATQLLSSESPKQLYAREQNIHSANANSIEL